MSAATMRVARPVAKRARVVKTAWGEPAPALAQKPDEQMQQADRVSPAAPTFSLGVCGSGDAWLNVQ